MKVGIMQPYFMPYIGYFQLMVAVDKYVIYDDVNYIKRGWSARNNIIVNGQKHLFSVLVDGGSQNNLYTQVRIIDDFIKLRKTLKMNYQKAPYYVETMELLEKVFTFEDKRFNHFIRNSFEIVFNYLEISSDFVFSSELQNNKLLKGKDKIIDICKILDATDYYNAIGGQKLYDREKFVSNGIQLHFVNPELTEYPQFSSAFIPGLSMIDVLMMNSKKNVISLLRKYSLA